MEEEPVPPSRALNLSDAEETAVGNQSFPGRDVVFRFVTHEDIFNDTSAIARLQCYLTGTVVDNGTLGDDVTCEPTWDGLSCWPRTKGGSTAVLPCFPSLNGLEYDTSQNASKFCSSNGSWADYSNYSSCRIVNSMDSEADIGTTLYYIGYGLSLIALTIALWIFLYYKELRCLRNTIHVNLMVTYFLISITWITTATLQSVPSPAYHKAACFLYIPLTYLMGTNFFWMFVEGLYLYILVVKTFSVEVVRVHIYALIGWGTPAVIVTVWAAVKGYLSPAHGDPNISGGMCVWQIKDIYDCIFIVPVVLVLMTNIFFLGQIMWVLITKLRAATSVESQQYRKAAKALLVLIPLLGVTYVLVIWTPSHRTAKVTFTYLQIALLSTQGFTVAVLYCFLNGEVRNSVRHHLERWKTARALRKGEHTRRTFGYRSGSQKTASALQRGSCVSFSTTTTSCLGNSRVSSQGPRHSNGSYAHVAFKDETV